MAKKYAETPATKILMPNKSSHPALNLEKTNEAKLTINTRLSTPLSRPVKASIEGGVNSSHNQFQLGGSMNLFVVPYYVIASATYIFLSTIPRRTNTRAIA